MASDHGRARGDQQQDRQALHQGQAVGHSAPIGALGWEDGNSHFGVCGCREAHPSAATLNNVANHIKQQVKNEVARYPYPHGYVQDYPATPEQLPDEVYKYCYHDTTPVACPHTNLVSIVAGRKYMRSTSKELQHVPYANPSRAPITAAQPLQLQVSPPHIAQLDFRLQQMESFMQQGQGGGAQISAGLQLVPTHATRQLQLFRPQQAQGETAQPVPEHREAGSPGSQLSQVALQHPVADPGHPSAPLLGQAPEHEQSLHGHAAVQGGAPSSELADDLIRNMDKAVGKRGNSRGDGGAGEEGEEGEDHAHGVSESGRECRRASRQTLAGAAS